MNNANQAISRQERDVHSLTSQKDTRANELNELEARLIGLRERKEELEGNVEDLTRELLIARSGIDELAI